MKPYYQNPYKNIVLVPLDKLAECDMALGRTFKDAQNNNLLVMDKDWVIKYYTQFGETVDAYILKDPREYHMGIRYGNLDREYISPDGNQEKLRVLYNKYKPSWIVKLYKKLVKK